MEDQVKKEIAEKAEKFHRYPFLLEFADAHTPCTEDKCLIKWMDNLTLDECSFDDDCVLFSDNLIETSNEKSRSDMPLFADKHDKNGLKNSSRIANENFKLINTLDKENNVLNKSNIPENHEKIKESLSLEVFNLSHNLDWVNFKYRNFINKIEFADCDMLEQKPLVKKNKEVNFHETYLDFVLSIDLSKHNKTINRFNIHTFHSLFETEYFDTTIYRFLVKLANDNLLYDPNDKQIFVVILINSLSYLERILKTNVKNINTLKNVKNSIQITINKNINYLKPSSTEFISLTNNNEINKHILRIKKLKPDYDGSIFLNYFFQKYISRPNEDKVTFLEFQSKLTKSISEIDCDLLVSFLKNVFFFNTVLYNCITDIQLISSISKIYENKMKSKLSLALCKSIQDFFALILYKTTDFKIFDNIRAFLVDNFANELVDYGIFALENKSEIIRYLENNKESFNRIKLVIDIISGFTKILHNRYKKIGASKYRNAPESKTDFIRARDLAVILIKSFYVLKSALLVNIYRDVIRNLSFLLTIIERFKESYYEEVLEFNKQYWDTISKLILTYFKIKTSEISTVKKKRTKIQQDNVIEGFLKVLCKIEEYLIIKGDCVKLKSRSFSVKENQDSQI